MVLIVGLGDEVLQFGVFAATFVIGVTLWYIFNERTEFRGYLPYGDIVYDVLENFNIRDLVEYYYDYITSTRIWQRFFAPAEVVETEDASENVTDSSWLDFEADDSERISFYIKDLNDATRNVITSMRETVLNFKRRNFPNEIRKNCRIKLIYNGRVLEDQDTVSSSGIQEGCVMHWVTFPSKAELATMDRAAGSVATARGRANGGGGESSSATSGNGGNNSYDYEYDYNYNGPNNSDSNDEGDVSNDEENEDDEDDETLEENEDWDLTELFCGLLILSALTGWYCRFYYAFLFTEHSTFMLLFFTLVIFYTVYAINTES